MPRRRKDADLFTLGLQLVPLLFLLAFISPGFRAIIQLGGILLMWGIIIGLVGLIAFGIYRIVTRDARPPYLDDHLRNPSSTAYTPSPSRTSTGYAPSRPEPQPKSSPAPPPPKPPPPSIRDRLRVIDWYQFEKLMGAAYAETGYRVVQMGGANPDGGIDLIIERNGIQKAVQCKHWQSWNVGVRHVRELIGALTVAKISHGILITLRGYTQEAKDLAAKHGIEILDESDVVKLLEQVDAAYNPGLQVILHDDRKFCPKCGSQMILRTAAKGARLGNQFWGCSTYPRCKFILEFNQRT